MHNTVRNVGNSSSRDRSDSDDLIIVSLNELITCPNDKFRFPLHQGIEENLIAEKRLQYAQERAKVRVQIEREISETYAAENGKRHAEELRQRDVEIERFKAETRKAREDITTEVAKSFEERLRVEAGRATEARKKLAEFEKRESDLLLLKKELAEKEQALRIDAIRQVELEREKIRKATKAEEAQRTEILEKQLGEEKKTLQGLITELQGKNAEETKRNVQLQVQLNSIKANHDSEIQDGGDRS
jgi:hypothetical protein